MDDSDKKFVLLSIGANLGDKQKTIEHAFELIKEAQVLDEPVLSSLYETEPVGFKDQPWFMNAAIAGYTDLPVNNLIKLLKSIEYILGRKVRQKWHEREIDIDILLYGENYFATEYLTVPHPKMHERRFVLVPASEIAGKAHHPVLDSTIDRLLEICNDNSEVKLLK